MNNLKDNNETKDFIDLFLDAESDEILIAEKNKDVFKRSENRISKKLSTDEITAQCLVFLLAGYDTTANSLALTCHNLANNMEAQQFLQDEIDDICPDGIPSYEQLNSLKYADAVMKETLRLCPIAAFASC